jgi:hypothetical protein
MISMILMIAEIKEIKRSKLEALARTGGGGERKKEVFSF